MSTESATDFDWSVKIDGDTVFNVGIASQIKPERNDIYDYDQHAIICTNYPSLSIKIGKKTIDSKLTEHKTGDIIRFRFQSHAKKLLIDLVRNCKSL